MSRAGSRTQFRISVVANRRDRCRAVAAAASMFFMSANVEQHLISPPRLLLSILCLYLNTHSLSYGMLHQRVLPARERTITNENEKATRTSRFRDELKFLSQQRFCLAVTTTAFEENEQKIKRLCAFFLHLLGKYEKVMKMGNVTQKFTRLECTE